MDAPVETEEEEMFLFRTVDTILEGYAKQGVFKSSSLAQPGGNVDLTGCIGQAVVEKSSALQSPSGDVPKSKFCAEVGGTLAQTHNLVEQ